MSRDICRICRGLNVSGRAIDGECLDCRSLKSGECLSNYPMVRCPKCLHVFDAREAYCDARDPDGCFDIWCNECDSEFSVGVSTEITFTSPAAKDD